MLVLVIAVTIAVIGILLVNFAKTPPQAVLGAVIATLGMIGVVLWLVLFGIAAAIGRDLGQWGETGPTVHHWYQTLMQPDNPAVSCCGEADAYWADGYEADGDKYVAIITDERPDGPLRREHVDVGTRIVVPNNKLKFDQSNPTGHGVIFLSRGGYVWCYVAPGGV